MDTVARVVRLEGAAAVVALEADGGGCGRCNEPGGCRSGLLSQMFHTPSREFSVPNEIDARAGETVLIRLSTGGLARWSLTAYLFPVFAVLIGAALGASTAGESYSRDGGAICGSLVGLFFAAWLIISRLAPTSVSTGPRLVRLGDDIPSCRREDGP